MMNPSQKCKLIGEISLFDRQKQAAAWAILPMMKLKVRPKKQAASGKNREQAGKHVEMDHARSEEQLEAPYGGSAHKTGLIPRSLLLLIAEQKQPV